MGKSSKIYMFLVNSWRNLSAKPLSLAAPAPWACPASGDNVHWALRLLVDPKGTWWNCVKSSEISCITRSWSSCPKKITIRCNQRHSQSPWPWHRITKVQDRNYSGMPKCHRLGTEEGASTKTIQRLGRWYLGNVYLIYPDSLGTTDCTWEQERQFLPLSSERKRPYRARQHEDPGRSGDSRNSW